MRITLKVTPPHLLFMVDGEEIHNTLTHDERNALMPTLIRMSDPDRTNIVVNLTDTQLNEIVDQMKARLKGEKDTKQYTLSTEHEKQVNRFMQRQFQVIINLFDSEGNQMSAFVVSIMKRALSLLQAFKILRLEKNYVGTLSLIKEQYENLMLFYAVGLVKDHADFLNRYFSGDQIDGMRDSNGRNLDHTYLAETVAGQLKLRDAYKVWSGVSHHFDEMIISSFMERTVEARRKELKTELFDYRDTRVRVDEWDLQVANMLSISEKLTEYGETWVRKMERS